MPFRLDLLRSVRIAAGLSSDDVARASNQRVDVIDGAENGATVSGDAANAIAAALGVTLTTLGAAAL